MRKLSRVLPLIPVGLLLTCPAKPQHNTHILFALWWQRVAVHPLQTRLLLAGIICQRLKSTNPGPITAAGNDTWGQVSLRLICGNSRPIHWPSVSVSYSVAICALDALRQDKLTCRWDDIEWLGMLVVFSFQLGNTDLFLVVSVGNIAPCAILTDCHAYKVESIFTKWIHIVILKWLFMKA